MNGHSDLLVRLARCCNPVPGDDIVGFISRGRGVAIHRKSCPNLKNTEQVRLIEAHWENVSTSAFVVTLQIHATNTSGLLAKLTSMLSEMKLSIDSLNARIDKNHKAVIDMGVKVYRISDIDAIIRKVQTMPEVESVFRSTGA